MADLLRFPNDALRKRQPDAFGLLCEWDVWSVAAMSEGRIIELIPCETAAEAQRRAASLASASRRPFVGQVQRVIRLEAAE